MLKKRTRLERSKNTQNTLTPEKNGWKDICFCAKSRAGMKFVYQEFGGDVTQ